MGHQPILVGGHDEKVHIWGQVGVPTDSEMLADDIMSHYERMEQVEVCSGEQINKKLYIWENDSSVIKEMDGMNWALGFILFRICLRSNVKNKNKKIN